MLTVGGVCVKKSKGKQLIVPVIIVVLTVVFSLSMGIALLVGTLELAPGRWGLLSLVVSLLVAAAAIYVLCARIKEIRSGVEDDLGKY